MHNSNNSAVGKVIFTGTQLAQAKLLGISADTNNPNPNELQEQIEADTQAKISIIPRFSEAKVQNGDVPVELINYMARKSKALNAEFDGLCCINQFSDEFFHFVEIRQFFWQKLCRVLS